MIKLELLTSSLGCEKCKSTKKMIKEIVEQYKDKIEFIETDIIKNPDKIIKFNVMTTPTIIINEKLAFEGLSKKNEINKKIEELLFIKKQRN